MILELSEILANIEKQKKELFEQAIVDIQIEAKQEMVESSDGYYISAIVKIKNKGNRNTKLDFSSPFFLKVNEIAFDSNGNSYQTNYLEQKAYNPSIMIMPSEATNDFPYFIKVNKKGLFVIEAWIILDEKERYIDNAFRGEELSETYWTGKTYVNIK